MCVIVIKPKGVDVPGLDTLRACWEANPDGAGIAYVKRNAVEIHKGLMTFDEFARTLKAANSRNRLKTRDVVFHFRIATAGGVRPGMTHPFPISPEVFDLNATDLRCPVAVVHNGTIETSLSDGMSDTASYIKSRLARLYADYGAFWEDEEILDKIEWEIGSKMAFITPAGIRTVGRFYKTDGNLVFSNLYWKRRVWEWM